MHAAIGERQASHPYKAGGKNTQRVRFGSRPIRLAGGRTNLHRINAAQKALTAVKHERRLRTYIYMPPSSSKLLARHAERRGKSWEGRAWRGRRYSFKRKPSADTPPTHARHRLHINDIFLKTSSLIYDKQSVPGGGTAVVIRIKPFPKPLPSYKNSHKIRIPLKMPYVCTHIHTYVEGTTYLKSFKLFSGSFSFPPRRERGAKAADHGLVGATLWR